MISVDRREEGREGGREEDKVEDCGGTVGAIPWMIHRYGRTVSQTFPAQCQHSKRVRDCVCFGVCARFASVIVHFVQLLIFAGGRKLQSHGGHSVPHLPNLMAHRQVTTQSCKIRDMCSMCPIAARPDRHPGDHPCRTPNSTQYPIPNRLPTVHNLIDKSGCQVQTKLAGICYNQRSPDATL